MVSSIVIIDIQILNADLVSSKVDRRPTRGCYVFVGGNFVSWRSKKQNLVSHSSAELEYRAMAQLCEIIWMHQLLDEVGLKASLHSKL